MSGYSLNEKLKIINSSCSLGELPVDAMPFAQNEEYYFVSYSHADYKEVYCDILRLQEQGINIWYDRGLPAGMDWEMVAKETISKYACAGVIFYVSKNSLLSDAVANEIKFVQATGKDYLSINLPMNNGESKSQSASSMLNSLCQSGSVSKQKREIVESAFNDKILFIDYNAPADFKAEKIKLLKRQPLINYQIKTDSASGKKIAMVSSVSDLFVSKIEIPSIAEVDKKAYKVKQIGDCAFANCKFLTEVVMPKNKKLKLGTRAFYGCESLEGVDLSNFLEIEDFAFANCKNLSRAILPSTVMLGSGVFSGTKLSDISVVKRAGEQTLVMGDNNYKRDNLHKDSKGGYLVGKGNLKKYGYKFGENVLFYDMPNDNGFLDITSYYNILSDLAKGGIPDVEVFAIGDGAFANRNNLKNLRLSKFTRVIGDSAFENCENLETFNFVTSNLFMQAKYGYGFNRMLSISKNFVEHPLIVGAYAFNGCAKLKEVNLPVFVKIQEYAFANCTNLQKVNFSMRGDGGTDDYSSCENAIGEYSFARCVSLEQINISLAVNKICENAFYGCKNLKAVGINPAGNLKFIDKSAFNGCDNLKIYYAGDKEDFLKIEQTGNGERIEKQFEVVCLNGTVY